ncbi:NADH dehydrogenase [ubiquinone] 1 alpha subcomplex subunit 13 [Yarrowia sp. C11]|nr:NADH dehydrogenase [ubiquinone] 1 alpha subcomplex subunit 13 [Yarrowia sp. C11]
MPSVGQDLPPVGGYEPVQWRRNLPSRGFRPLVYLAALCGVCGYGFYRALGGIQERRELKREKLWARIYLMPLLQAEEDRQTVRRSIAQLEREKEIMKGTGFDVDKSVYNDGKFHAPALMIPPK